MKRVALLIAYVCLAFTAIAQNRLSSLLDMKPCENIPCADKPIASWVDSLVKPFFISDLQFSNSRNGDARFLSFSLIGRTSPMVLMIPETPVKVLLNTPSAGPYGSRKTRSLYMEWRNNMLAYTHAFNAATFNYTPYSYYRLGITMYRLNETEALSTAIMQFVDRDHKSNEDRKKLLLQDIYNAGFTIDITPAAYDNIDSVVKHLRKHNPDIYKLIYQVYLHQQSEHLTKERVGDFFSRINGSIIEELNNKMDVQLNADMGEDTRLLIPPNWFRNKDSAITELPFRYIEYTYKRAEHKMVVVYKLSGTDTLQVVHGADRHESPVSGKLKYSTKAPLKAIPDHLVMEIHNDRIEMYFRSKHWNTVDLYNEKRKSN
jgi:hypothetical protein